MGIFSHISDVHLGAFNDDYLRKNNLDSFIWALEKSREENVDFIIISGDLFNNPIPNISQVIEAITKMKEIVESGIKIYTVYGSHDYSVTGSSIYNVLVASGIIMDVHRPRNAEGKMILEPVVDIKTGARIYGMFARKMGMESSFYERLAADIDSDSFNIFVFHSAIREICEDLQFRMAEIPLSYLPPNFDYYAGGHLHRRRESEMEGYGKIVYPGVLYASNFFDLEEMALGVERGFYIVEFSENIEKMRFIRNDIGRPVLIDIDANGKVPDEVMSEASRIIDGLDLRDRYILIKIQGELSSGKTSQVDRKKLKEYCMKKGASGVNININNLTSREYRGMLFKDRRAENIERELIEKYVKQYGGRDPSLKGEKGVNMAISLLELLKIQRNEEESREDFERRIRDGARRIIGEDGWQ
ncbi:MAG: metallophosphoesterase family protein [Thermoplasmata archaeon]|jgi:DNA repair exonuclease SbcCD nuclease subunit